MSGAKQMTTRPAFYSKFLIKLGKNNTWADDVDEDAFQDEGRERESGIKSEEGGGKGMLKNRMRKREEKKRRKRERAGGEGGRGERE